MHSLFLFIFVVELFIHTEAQGPTIEVHPHVLRGPANPALSDDCNCQAARNDYTYRFPEAVRFSQDPAFHYEYVAESGVLWNCELCKHNPIFINSSTCMCADAVTRYQQEYKVYSNEFQNYQQQWRTNGKTWHCELCLVSSYPLPSPPCIEAIQSYTNTYAHQLNNMDAVFHYITYGYWDSFIWPSSICTLSQSTYYPFGGNCSYASTIYLMLHDNNIWGYTSALEHYLNTHLQIGWSWFPNACQGGQTITKAYDCWYARYLYWAKYPEVITLGFDPVFHYQIFQFVNPNLVWDFDVCQKSYGRNVWDSSCACLAAADLYQSTYHPDVTWADPKNAWLNWTNSYLINGHAWHCELCDLPLGFIPTPIHLLPAATCVAARDQYSARYQITAYDPVWHYENIGYIDNVWESGLCNGGEAVYLTTSDLCQSCKSARDRYKLNYPAARYWDPYKHWQSFYLAANTSKYGYVFECSSLCSLIPVVPGPTVNSTTGAATTATTSTIYGGPYGAVQTLTTSQDSSNNDGGDSIKLGTTAILAIVIPVVAVLSVGIGMLFIQQQRRQAVQALITAEEGERRNYKIDFVSLSIDWLIGSGSFGHVYRGEYRGADVAIKKLKKQNMGNQQLEDLAKEAMVMVGLRHPHIVLFMGVCLERPELCIVTEYMPRGNLYDVLHDGSIKLPFAVVRSMALHIVKGLQFIHSAGMIHRDLKSPNLLVDANWTIKIADFGLSCAKSQVSDDVQISLLWTAPEILMREKHCYTEKSDIYSLGVILWELMSRQTPFSDFTAAAIPPIIVLGKRPVVQPQWNAAMKLLIAQCWGQLPSHRPAVREVRVSLESIVDADGGIAPSTPTAREFDDLSSANSDFPPRGQVTVVFYYVDNAAQLWDADPQTMLVALRTYNETCRKLLRHYGGYESQTEGDASLVTFSETVNAINFCLAAQRALIKADWPDQLLKQTSAQEEFNNEGSVLYRGLRVRMGVHCGQPHCEQDELTLRAEYFGPVVNIAARVAAHAHGGQIIATTAVYQRLANNLARLDPCVADQLGSCSVRGIPEPLELYQLWPKDLDARGAAQGVLDFTQQGAQQHDAYMAADSHESTSSSTSSDYAWNLRHSEKWIIEHVDLQLDNVVGTGSFGDVYAGLWRGQRVAIKQFMRQRVSDEILLEMRTESGILSSIQHPNIIKFMGMCIKIPHLCIVTELLDRGSLSTIILGNDVLPWAQRKNFAIDIAKGLEYLHQNNIIHRDVKSPNMLVAEDWTIKIADFGFSRVKSENHTMTQCGTVAWTAPEIFLGERYTEKADVYSYSVILWELVFRKKPWQGMNSMKVCHSVESGERLPIHDPPYGTPEHIMTLMQACWLQDHERRPSFTDVLRYIQR